ncbi:4a-hydroxytetrahydrobiopterin dehydratase [Phycicoccus sp. CSK15P-2]|uniref:VOC family protein n=1 Tax=Phycicoccus sp. CSK15P-2 TaxID=2807627 RepID=UPI001951C77E|nr:VOC family protein [Phycicoccus sp. CSK15P-2]MBM6405877.1 4a-hydroxytetrahydrobiopterin dehydratase [Phycicoccus sp. CSK15P-2]
MTDTERLSFEEVREAGPDDWRQIIGRLKARYRTADFASGVALVHEIGKVTDAGRRPEVVLTDADVVVALPGASDAGVTRTDLEAAARISEAAARLGASADPGGITQLELGLDTTHGEELAPVYAALLGSEVVQGEPVDRTGQVPTLWWQGPPDGDAGPPLPEPTVPQRWHADVWVATDEGERRVAAVLEAGGRLVSDAAAPSYWVVEDADGNRSCVCTVADRGR